MKVKIVEGEASVRKRVNLLYFDSGGIDPILNPIRQKNRKMVLRVDHDFLLRALSIPTSRNTFRRALILYL